jgi:hypothetical protein
MKSDDFIGEMYNLNINELVLSLAISIPEKREMKDRPNTHIPGVRWSIAKSSTGILA